MNILLTGYTGFLGSALNLALDESTVLLGRVSVPNRKHYFSSFAPGENYFEALKGVDCIVHCAARAHVMADLAPDPLFEFRKVNTIGTLDLACQAAEAGVKRFIFISSINVSGKSTMAGEPFNSNDTFIPESPFGLSKYEAEEGLKRIAKKTGMEVVIIRSPLVYGPGVKANFLSLLKIANTALPLPFGAVRNRRSMIYIDNLVDFIVRCIDHPKAGNQTFLVSDGQDLSLRQLIVLLRKAMGRSVRLLPVPEFVFRMAGAVIGKRELVESLIGSLQVDMSHAKNLLDWKAPFTVEQGIQVTVEDFLVNNKKDGM